MSLRRRLTAALAVLALTCGSGAPAGTVTAGSAGVPVRDPRLVAGFDLAYNLDYEAAVASFGQAIAARPEDPAGYRGVAAASWLHILYLRGAAVIDTFLTGSTGGPNGAWEEPPDTLARRFEEHVTSAIRLSEVAVRRDENDPAAHYELGIAVALDASYRASVRGQPLRALRGARRAYAAHLKVLELDPTHHDAKLLVGLYRYIVSVMPPALRWVAYLVGFDGGREEALELVADAAAHPGEVQSEAQFALVLLYNREREYALAQAVLSDLKRAFPRNRLVWLESASTWLRDDRPAMAELTLAHGFTRLQGDDRPRMFSEDAVWHLKRGTARSAIGLVDAARLDLARAARAEGPPWVAGRAHLELGKLADLAGEHQRARGHYVRSRKLCDEAGDRACRRAATTFRRRPYTRSG